MVWKVSQFEYLGDHGWLTVMVADKIKIEKVPTSSVEKTDVLIGFSVVELPKNSLQMLDSGKFWSIFSILKIEK